MLLASIVCRGCGEYNIFTHVCVSRAMLANVESRARDALADTFTRSTSLACSALARRRALGSKCRNTWLALGRGALEPTLRVLGSMGAGQRAPSRADSPDSHHYNRAERRVSTSKHPPTQRQITRPIMAPTDDVRAPMSVGGRSRAPRPPIGSARAALLGSPVMENRHRALPRGKRFTGNINSVGTGDHPSP